MLNQFLNFHFIYQNMISILMIKSLQAFNTSVMTCNQQNIDLGDVIVYCMNLQNQYLTKTKFQNSVLFAGTFTSQFTQASIFYGVYTFRSVTVNSSSSQMSQQFFSLTTAKQGDMNIQNSFVTITFGVTVTSAALIAYNISNLIVYNSEMHLLCSSTLSSGVALYITNSIQVQNMTLMNELNQSSTSNNFSGICFNFTGIFASINASRLSLDSNADYASLLISYSGSIVVSVNMTYFGGYIQGSNTKSIGLLVGTANSDSNLSWNNSQICIFNNSFSNYFSLGTVIFNSTTTNHTLTLNLSSYGFNQYNSSTYYYYALKAIGVSYNNSEIYVQMSNAVTSSGSYYGIFGAFTVFFQIRIWGTQTESTAYTGILLTNMSTAVYTTCLQINITIQQPSSSYLMLFGSYATASNFANTYINLTQTTSNYGNLYGLLYYQTSGIVVFNNTTFSLNASCSSCSYLNMGIYVTQNSGTKTIFYNGTFSVKFYYTFYSSYLTLFSYEPYSYCNLTVYNFTTNVSNGSSYAYIYGNSYLYGGAVCWLESYANFTVYNSTFYSMLYIYNYEEYFGILAGYTYQSYPVYEKVTTTGNAYFYYPYYTGLMGQVYYSTVYYNDSIQSISVLYAISSTQYWSLFSYLYGPGYFYSTNISMNSSVYATTSSNYNGIFGYTYNYTYNMYNWTTNLYLYGSGSYQGIFVYVYEYNYIYTYYFYITGTTQGSLQYLGQLISYMYYYCYSYHYNSTFSMSQLTTASSPITGIIGYAYYYCNTTTYYLIIQGYQNMSYCYYLGGIAGIYQYYDYNYFYNTTFTQSWYITSNNWYGNAIIIGYCYYNYAFYVTNLTAAFYTSSTYMGLMNGYSQVVYAYMYNCTSNYYLTCYYSGSFSEYAKSNVYCSN